MQHPAAPLWAGSRKALVAVGGAVLWWAVSCRVLLGFLGLFPAGRRVLLLGRQLFFQDAFSAPRSAGSQHWRRKPRPHLGHFSSNYPAGCPARCTWARVGCQGAPPTRRRLWRRRAVASARPSSGQVLAVDPVGCTLLAMRQRLRSTLAGRILPTSKAPASPRGYYWANPAHFRGSGIYCWAHPAHFGGSCVYGWAHPAHLCGSDSPASQLFRVAHVENPPFSRPLAPQLLAAVSHCRFSTNRSTPSWSSWREPSTWATGT